MPDRLNMTVTGLAETVKMLDEMPDQIVALGYVKALTAGGMIIQNEVERRTPIQLRESGGLLIVEGGRLRDALGHWLEIDSRNRGGTFEIGFGNKQGHVALWVEYGHRLLSHWEHKELYREQRSGRMRVKKWGGHQFIKNIPAYPFMRPSVEATADAAIEAFAASLAQTVNAFNSKAA